MLYSHWVLIASLVKLGMSYKEILELSESELTFLYATLSAMADRENDQMKAQSKGR